MTGATRRDEPRRPLKARTLNRAVTAARADAEQHLPALTGIYQAALEQTASRAARTFASMTAAAWQPPPEGTVLATAAVIATRAAIRTARLQEQILTLIADTTSVRLGIAWDVKHPLAQALLAQAGQRTGANIDAAVQPVLRAIVADAYDNGLSVPDTSALIRAGLTEAAPWQADMLARTDLNGLANGGSVIAARLAGAPFKAWLATLDDRTRETHAEADGQTVPVDATFTVGGEQLDFPGDPAGSDAEVCNCRCSLVYTDSLAASAAAPTLAPGGQMTKLGTPIAKASTTMKGSQRLAARLAAMPAGMQEMPTGVKACTMNGTPGYTGGSACHIHDGSEAGMRSAMRKAKADAGKNTSASLAAARSLGAIPFTGTAAIEGCVTDDNSPTPRVLLARSLSWPDLPVPFMAQTVTADGHDGAEVAGRIDSFKRVKGATAGTWAIEFKGELTTPFGINEVAPMVADQTLRGVSIDLGAAEYALVDRATLERVDESAIDLEALASGGYALGLTTGKIRAATLCPVQAIEGANVALAASAAGEAVASFTADLTLAAALVASAAPALPPAAWFETPEPPGKMPLTITDDGRVFGHLALAETCHTGLAGVCVTPPRSASGYAYFHVGEVETAEGRRLPVGKLMLASKGGRHAPLSDSRADAARHYDDTSTVAAYLRATDGRYGIWVAGALNPALSAERVRELRTLPPSGDWREVNGELELIAALAVPVPGFPVPRAAATLVASAEEVELSALVASSGRFEAAPLVVRALEQAGLLIDVEAEARTRALLARAESGVEGLLALAEAPAAPARSRRLARDAGPPLPAEDPPERDALADAELDEQVSAALGTLANVTEMATRVEAAEQRATEMARLVEAAREEHREDTAAQKRETLAAIESMTAQIAAGGKISEAMLAAVGQLADRKPRQVTILRDEQGRAAAYEVA